MADFDKPTRPTYTFDVIYGCPSRVREAFKSDVDIICLKNQNILTVAHEVV